MLCKDSYKKCPYLPDMDCQSNEWEYDENGIKRRKNKKEFKCMYDRKKLDWNRECPRDKEIEEN